MLEKVIEKYLVGQCKKHNIFQRKVAWIGVVGCPDRLIMTPCFTCFVELKAPDKTPRPSQLREHERLEKAGQVVFVTDTKDKVDELINLILMRNKNG